MHSPTTLVVQQTALGTTHPEIYIAEVIGNSKLFIKHPVVLLINATANNSYMPLTNSIYRDLANVLSKGHYDRLADSAATSINHEQGALYTPWRASLNMANES